MRGSQSYCAVVVTYRRPESLDEVLRSLELQTLLPGFAVIVDNDPARSAEPVIAAAQRRGRLDVRYSCPGENLGPAGGWGLGAASASGSPDRGRWLLVIDDDDPLGHPQVVERLLSAVDGLSAPARCGAIGLRGATVRRWTGGLLGRDQRTSAPATVDYLASGGAPLYRWSAIEEVGFFDDQLFFGFEDLDQGLRMRSEGWDLWAVPMPHLHVVADSAGARSSWREYYKVRALTVIVRRHLGVVQLVWLTLRTVVMGSVWLTLRSRSLALARARAHGWVDGLRGLLGRRRYLPVANPPKGPAHRSP